MVIRPANNMSSKAVNRPTNVKQKEADINQKLQLYGISTGELHLVIDATSRACFSCRNRFRREG